MKNFLIIAFYCLMLLGCKKKDIDYRTKFTGDYNFVIHQYRWHPPCYPPPYPPCADDTTYTTYGKIENYGSSSNYILISYPGFSLITTIYEDGTLTGYWNNNGKGEFSSTKEMIYTFRTGGLGASTSNTITGTKK